MSTVVNLINTLSFKLHATFRVTRKLLYSAVRQKEVLASMNRNELSFPLEISLSNRGYKFSFKIENKKSLYSLHEYFDSVIESEVNREYDTQSWTALTSPLTSP